MKTKFIGSSLEKCIGDACKLFDVEEEELDYEIVQKKKGLFIKKVVIEASPLKEKTSIKEDKLEEIIKEKDVENIEKDEVEERQNQGTIRIQDGEIIVKNPQKNGKPATILIEDEVDYIDVKIDGKEVVKRADVYEHSIIEVS